MRRGRAYCEAAVNRDRKSEKQGGVRMVVAA
jgi:hypothetical protein